MFLDPGSESGSGVFLIADGVLPALLKIDLDSGDTEPINVQVKYYNILLLLELLENPTQQT